MKEILKKLDDLDRKSIELSLEMIKRYENEPGMGFLCEQCKWRIYGMADALFHHKIITADEYLILSQSHKWGVA